VVAATLFGTGLVAVALRGGSYDVTPRVEASIVVWWVLGLGCAFGLLPTRRMTAAQRVAVAALLGIAAWTMLGLVWTSSAERTMLETSRAVGYTGLVLLVAWAFGARHRALLVAAVSVGCAVICVLAFVARLAPELLRSALAKSGYAESRLDFPFNYWNALGCWAAMTLALALAFSAHAPARWQRGAALAVAPLALVVTYLTYSRGATLNVALACALVIVLSSRRWLAAINVAVAGAAAAAVIVVIRAHPEVGRGTGTDGRATVALALILAMGLAFALAASAHAERLARLRLSPRIWKRTRLALLPVILLGAIVASPELAPNAWRSFQGPDTPITSDPARRLTTLGGNRHDLWPVAIDIFGRQPLHGIGAGTFEFAWNTDPRRSGHVIDAHSLYLESLAELWLPGAVLVITALGALLVAAVRNAFRIGDGAGRGAAAGAAAAFVVFCVGAGVDWMWESTAVALTALALGTVAAAGHAPATTAVAPVADPSSGPPVRRWRVRTAGAVVALAAILAQLPMFVAASEIRASQKAVASGQLVDALANANAAADSAPWAASGRLQRALVLERVGQLAVAERAAAQATRLEQRNWALWLVLGRIRAERGQLTSALTAVARARELNPRSPLFQPGVASRLARPGG
jgi:hypothetical protein